MYLKQIFIKNPKCKPFYSKIQISYDEIDVDDHADNSKFNSNIDCLFCLFSKIRQKDYLDFLFRINVYASSKAF